MNPTLDERIAALEQTVGAPLTDRALALAALTHRSYVNEHRLEGVSHGERLEFLGDAVIDLAVSHRLMERFPQASEGELSKLRALIVSEEGLARIARQMALGPLLLLGRGEERSGGRSKSSVLADALESIIGVVYLSGGMDQVLDLVDRHFGAALEGVAEGRNGADFKTLLQELAQEKRKVSPKYRVVAESGPDHEKTFEVEVSIVEIPYARASGRSKKEAEQAAAKQALERLKETKDEP